MSCAIRYGVPRSTASSWLTAPSLQVVTDDPLNMDVIQPQQEVLRLRTRIHKLIALLSVLLVVLKISMSHSTRPDFPTGSASVPCYG